MLWCDVTDFCTAFHKFIQFVFIQNGDVNTSNLFSRFVYYNSSYSRHSNSIWGIVIQWFTLIVHGTDFWWYDVLQLRCWFDEVVNYEYLMTSYFAQQTYLMIRDGTNGNSQDFRITDRIESLKSKIESNRRIIKSNVCLFCVVAISKVGKRPSWIID